ncbi:hypothetical protein [Cupriavidus sp. D39]|uniref:hypothetical protein n=1 Tax=Cupriavidus sp. D39 TaxID=2997877 RepID=UPI00226FA37C|nr:hypothetical protein [Cupriavidus sp. D39]MCY0852939.1 hypothetical protein [Cupriavidus sp. D39]
MTAAIVALDELLTVIPISLLTNLSGIGDARHIGTGGARQHRESARVNNQMKVARLRNPVNSIRKTSRLQI